MIVHRGSDIVVVDKDAKTALLKSIDIAVPGDTRVGEN